MSENRDGFEIKGVFYPWAQEMKLSDAPLVVEVTGMKYNEFLRSWQSNIEKVTEAEEIGEDVDPLDLDPIVVNGLVAVAIWRQHPDWTRNKVVKYFERLEDADIDIYDTEEEGKETGPLTGTGSSMESGSSSTTASSSNGKQESPSETTRGSTGPPTLVTSSPDSPPTG